MASPSDLGVEDVAVKLPLTIDLLHHEDLAVAFAAFGTLALGRDGAMRPGANEAKVAAQLGFLDVELNVEVELLEKVCIEGHNFLNSGSRGEGLADEDRVVGIDEPD